MPMFMKKEEQRRQNNGQTPPRAPSRSSVVAYSSNSQQQQQQHFLSPPRKTTNWVNIKEGDRPTNLYYYDDSTNNTTPRRRNSSAVATRMKKKKKKKLSLNPVTIILAAVTVAMSIMGCGFMLVINNENSEESSHTSSSSWHPRFPHVLKDDEEVHNVELPHHSQHDQAASVTVEVTPGTAYTSSSKRRRNQGTTTSDGSTLPDQLPPNFLTSPTLCPATHTLISQSKIVRSSYGTIFSVTTPPNPNGSVRPTPDQLKDMSVETITIQTLSLRMADYRPDLGTNFEVWLYTGDQNDLNDNDIDGNPFNNNKIQPSRGEYQLARAKFSDWKLLVIEPEEKLVPDTAFYDQNGHLYNIEPEVNGGTVLGDYKTFDHLEDVTIAAKEWNEGLLRPDGGMDATTQDEEFTKTYFYKIPEDLFVPLLLPKFDGKLTLFVTLERVGMQYGYAQKDEFDNIDVSKHDYIDQVKSLDTLNGNVNLQMHVGEGVIMYPWLEEEFFYTTRRFLGKIWYLAQIPCEYSDLFDRFRDTPMPSVQTTGAPSISPSFSPSGDLAIVGPGTLCMSTLMKEEKEEPMSTDTTKKLETMIEEFVGSALSNICLRNNQVTVINQTISALPIGGETTTPTAAARSGVGWGKITSTKEVKDQPSDSRNLGQLVASISSMLGSGLQQSMPSTRRLQVAISKLEIELLLEGMVNAENCPNRNETQMVEMAVNTISERNDDFMAELKNVDEYFAEVFGVSVNNCEEVIIAAVAAVTADDEPPIGAIVGGVVAALLLCCLICCLPLLIVRRRKHKETELREIIGDEIAWVRPVHEDYFPPLGGVRGGSGGSADGDGDGTGFGARVRKGGYGGEYDEGKGDDGDLGLQSHSQLRPYGDESDMEYSHRFLDKDGSPTSNKSRAYGMPGRIPNEGDGNDHKGINIYPGGDIDFTEGDDDELRLRGIQKEESTPKERDDPFSQFNPEGGISQPRGGKWSYDADGGVNIPSRGGDQKSSAKPSWNRLPAQGSVMTKSLRNLSINPQVLARIQSVKQKMKDLRAVETEELAPPTEIEAQIFPPRESDDRISQLMNRIKSLENARTEKYERPSQTEGESDYEKWRRLQIGDGELSSSEDSSDENVNLVAAKTRKKKKKKEGKDYMINFDDLDAYNKALAVHEDAFIHQWVRVKVEKDVVAEHNAVKDEDGEGFLDLGDLGGDDTVDGRSLGGSTLGGTLVLGDLNDDDDDTGSYLGSIGGGSIYGDDESTIDLGTLGDDSSVHSLSSVTSKSSLTSRASSFISRISKRSKKSKTSQKNLDSMDPEEYLNEINAQRATKLSTIVRDRSLARDEKMRRMNDVKQWYVAALQRPERADDEHLGDLDDEDDADTIDDTIDLGSIGGDESTTDLGTLGDESDLSSLASKSTISRASSLVSRISKSKESLDSLDPEEYENEINAQRAAKLSTIVRDKSLSKDEKARRTEEVNKWYAAALQSPKRKGIGKRQQTEYLGDESSDDDEPPPKRPELGDRQATEYIGDMFESDDDSEIPARKLPPKRGLGARQQTQYIGDLGGGGSDDESFVGDLGGSDDESDDTPVASKLPPKRGLGARQQTQYIGDLGGGGSDDESFVGDLGGSDDESDDAPVARNIPPKRGLGARQQTQYIGDLGDDLDDDLDDEFGVAPSTFQRTQRPGRFSGPSSAQDSPQKRSSTIRFAEPKMDEDSPVKRAPSQSALKKPSALRSSMAASQQSLKQTEEKPKTAKVLTEKELSAQRSAKLSTIMRDRSLDRDERKRRIDEVKQWYEVELAALSRSSSADLSTPKAGVRKSEPFSQPSSPPPATPPLQSMVIEYINTLDSLADLKEDLEGMPMPALQRLAAQLNIEQPRDKPRPRLEQMIAESIESIRKF